MTLLGSYLVVGSEESRNLSQASMSSCFFGAGLDLSM